VRIAEHIEKIKNACGLLDVTAHFREHIEGSAIDQLYFVDQYKWMDFGRGKIAELAFYGKDTQHRGLLEECIQAAQAQIECLIHTGKFDVIAITPHSKKRSIQLLKELQRIISWGAIPMIKLVKYAPHGVIVAQKSLKTRQQRIQNAKETILLNDAREVANYKHVLLLDDFVGSGATLNETAKKLKAAGVREVTGLALVGNATLSYEVIQEI
jgi:predicted amidophosphoribosyltransferase